MDNSKRFSGRAEAYTKGRPGYPQSLIDCLYTDYGFCGASVIADIGAGTGKFARQLLDRGSTVYCVEPNDDMRAVAENELECYRNFISVNGSSDMTNLNGSSVDFVTAAQAFHWFDADKFKKECKRILKPDGRVVLVWNTRDMNSEFNIKSYEIYKKYCPMFKGYHGGMRDDDKRISDFFSNRCEKITFENPLVFTKDKFITRSLSASYSLKKGDNDFDIYINGLESLFDEYAENGVVEMKNNTTAYIGAV